MGCCYSVYPTSSSNRFRHRRKQANTDPQSSKLPKHIDVQLIQAATQTGWHLTKGTISSPTRFWQPFPAFGDRHSLYTLEDCIQHIQRHLHTDRDWLEGVVVYYGDKRIPYKDAEAIYLHLQSQRQQLMRAALSNTNHSRGRIGSRASVPAIPNTVVDIIGAYINQTPDYKQVLNLRDVWEGVAATHERIADAGIALAPHGIA